jgi:hypothetical protein
MSISFKVPSPCSGDMICSTIAGGVAAAAESLQHPRRSEVRLGDQGRGGTRGAGAGGPLARLHGGTAAALETPSRNTGHSAPVHELSKKFDSSLVLGWL